MRWKEIQYYSLKNIPYSSKAQPSYRNKPSWVVLKGMCWPRVIQEWSINHHSINNYLRSRWRNVCLSFQCSVIHRNKCRTIVLRYRKKLIYFTDHVLSLMRGHSLAPNGTIWKRKSMFSTLLILKILFSFWTYCKYSPVWALTERRLSNQLKFDSISQHSEFAHLGFCFSFSA